ncbi:hypothetical protein F4777DRAFT_566374 [Nemania sp. FL0916]|nr:hypothetical protein F4777DRAFT_566374 [Nemania sp. FL0916]
MKFHSLFVVAQLGVAWALSSQLERDIYVPCTDLLYDTAYCCVDDIFNGYTDCQTPPIWPISASDFQNQCAWIGKLPACCLRPIIGTPVLLCSTPPGLGPFNKN